MDVAATGTGAGSGVKSLRPSKSRKVADDLSPSLGSGPGLCQSRYAQAGEGEIRGVLQNNAVLYRGRAPGACTGGERMNYAVKITTLTALHIGTGDLLLRDYDFISGRD